MVDNKLGRSSGSALVIGATLLAGLGGYAIVTLMARSLGESYGHFAVFWALLYLAIGTFSGIQQEVSRGTLKPSLVSQNPQNVTLFSLAFQLALIVAILMCIVMFFLAPLFFSTQLIGFSGAVVSGATLSVFVGVLAGGLYGTHSWRPLAVLIVADVLFRLILLGAFSYFTHNVVLLAWICSIPFVLVLFCVIPMSKNTVNKSTALDINIGQAYRNIGRTVGASFGAAVLVSGFPALLAVSEGVDSQASLSAVIYALTLTRAPLVVGILALQSFLVVKFRDFSFGLGALVLKFNIIVLLIGIVLSTAAFVFGNQVIVFLAGSKFSLSPEFLALLTLSSVPTAWLAITGAATLSKKLHTSYSIAWLFAALASIATLFIPNEIETKLIVALIVGPLIGVSLNTISLVRQGRAN